MDICLLDNSNSFLLKNIAPGVFDNEIDPGSLNQFVSCARHTMALAVEDGVVIGMASGVEYFHPDKNRQFWINEIGVTPERRREGIGRKLIEKMIDYARECGCSCSWLGTGKTNLPANRCFSSVPGGELPKDFVMYEWK